jgi:hypothetical protein
MKHTPGPWKEDDMPYRENIIEIRDERGQRQCVVVADWPQSARTQTANARLIAAAPEMLKELLKARAYLITVDLVFRDPDGSAGKELVAEIDNLIESATGLSIAEVLQ